MYLLMFLIGILLAPEYDALKYLDPGSGSFLIQLLIGAIVGLAVVIKAYWGRIKGFFVKSSDQSGGQSSENTPAADDHNNAS
jgi:hypothetical protein